MKSKNQDRLTFKWTYGGQEYTFDIFETRTPYNHFDSVLAKKYPNARIVYPKACECNDTEYAHYTGEYMECTCVASDWFVEMDKNPATRVPLMYSKKKGHYQPYTQPFNSDNDYYLQ